MPAKIKIHNDGKGRPYSFQAYLEYPETYNLGGENEEKALEALQEEVSKIIAYYNSIDYSNIEYVDCLGNKLQELKNKVK